MFIASYHILTISEFAPAYVTCMTTITHILYTIHAMRRQEKKEEGAKREKREIIKKLDIQDASQPNGVSTEDPTSESRTHPPPCIASSAGPVLPVLALGGMGRFDFFFLFSSSSEPGVLLPAI